MKKTFTKSLLLIVAMAMGINAWAENTANTTYYDAATAKFNSDSWTAYGASGASVSWEDGLLKVDLSGVTTKDDDKKWFRLSWRGKTSETSTVTVGTGTKTGYCTLVPKGGVFAVVKIKKQTDQSLTCKQVQFRNFYAYNNNGFTYTNYDNTTSYANTLIGTDDYYYFVGRLAYAITMKQGASNQNVWNDDNQRITLFRENASNVSSCIGITFNEVVTNVLIEDVRICNISEMFKYFPELSKTGVGKRLQCQNYGNISFHSSVRANTSYDAWYYDGSNPLTAGCLTSFDAMWGDGFGLNGIDFQAPKSEDTTTKDALNACTSLFSNVKNTYINNQTGSTGTWVSGNNISTGNNAVLSKFVLTDGYALDRVYCGNGSGTKWIKANTFEYTRDFGTAGAGTMVLPFPFKVPAETTAKVYTLTYTSGTTATATQQTVGATIEAGTPVYVKATGSVTFNSPSGEQKIINGDYSTTILEKSGNALYGTYVQKVVDYSIETPFYILIDNAGTLGFYQANKSIINPFRAYLSTTKESSAKSITIVFDDEPTGINEVTDNNTSGAIKFVKNGQLLIKTANGTFNAAGQLIK